MSYRLERRDASLTDALRRIALAEIAAIRAAWAAGPQDPEAVHEMRKSLKKLRALLRLVRDGMPEDQLAENRVLRDAARSLAGHRDAAVRLATLDRLIGPPAGSGEPVAPDLAALRARLAREAAEPGPAPDLDALLSALEERAAGWQLHGPDRRILARGLARTRRQARRAMMEAHRDRDPEAMHEWRKRAKDHWYQARLFQPVWPAVMKPIVAEVDTLGEALGEHHDISVLMEWIERQDPAPLSGESLDLLSGRARAEQDRIEEAAFARGARLFAGDPDEMAALWLDWRRIWRAEPEGGDD